ncbi:MAG: DUF2156 domain-containing protein [Deltaproteobacteria bacterium]|nr:DUF2156 domain-containing protein [Deltaproteobacteria bacterium]
MLLDFKPVQLQHKKIFDKYLKEDPPDISELTFTNLFMWQALYHPVWTELDNVLLIILNPEGKTPFGLQPVGQGNRAAAMKSLIDYLSEKTPEPKICRASESFVTEVVDTNVFSCLPDRDNSDYVYSTLDLIHLPGRKYHRKKNHLNKFKKHNQYEYRKLDLEIVECFIDMQEQWCRMRECMEMPDLLTEDYAVRMALTHFEELDYQGGAIKINGKIEAFSLGERLNQNTAVIHIEKANPEIPGLYAAINQMFCSNAWAEIEFINREQDLGVEGLRKAKESYLPHHMIDKYTIIKKE